MKIYKKIIMILMILCFVTGSLNSTALAKNSINNIQAIVSTVNQNGLSSWINGPNCKYILNKEKELLNPPFYPYIYRKLSFIPPIPVDFLNNQNQQIPESLQDEIDPVDEIIKTTLPSNDTNPDYLSFENEILTIIRKSEQKSGIKSTYGVFVMDLKTNYHTGINKDLTKIDPYDNNEDGYFNSASVIKLFQGYIICDMLRNNELSAENIYEDKITGRSFKLLDMIHTMISKSDNNLSNASLRIVNNTKSNEVLNRLGIVNSKIYGEMGGAIGYSQSRNLKEYGTIKRCARLTPADAGLILYNIYINKDTDIYMSALNKALIANVYNSRIPVGVKKVNPDYKIAHKTGTNSNIGVYNDAGIIYCERPYILVAFTQDTSSSNGHSFIRDLSENLTIYFNNKK